MMKTKSIAILFPGQGSQSVGMCKEIAHSFPTAMDCIKEVDEALGEDLSSMMFDGDIEELTETKNAQPAIMSASIAVWSVLKKEVFDKQNMSDLIAAGHSVGEYGALSSSGALSLTQTALLLRARGEAMQRAVPKGYGGMTALLGCDIEKARELVSAVRESGICEVANDNAAGQVVISGMVTALDAVDKMYTDFGIKRAVRLGVSAPFHSSLMAPAAKDMKEKLMRAKVGEMSFPVISNYLAKPNSDSSEVAELLVKQIEGMVRWRETMEYLLDEEKRTVFIEVGCGSVLGNIVKRLNSEVKVFSVNKAKDIDDVVSFLAG